MLHINRIDGKLNLSKDYIFLPTLKITLMDNENVEAFSKRFFKITSDGIFDMEDLRPYIYIALNMKKDMVDKKEIVEALFRNCNWEDFNQFNH